MQSAVLKNVSKGVNEGLRVTAIQRTVMFVSMLQNFARKIKKYLQTVATYISFYTDRFTLIIQQVLQDFYLSIYNKSFLYWNVPTAYYLIY